MFEGVDASGKSSLSTAFCNKLVEDGYPAEIATFPGKVPGTLGELVYRLHHGHIKEGIKWLTPASLQALHVAAHLDAIERIIVPALMGGKWIVLDRFWWSTWVYGIVGGIEEAVLNSLIEAERHFWGPWQPDALFHVSRTTPLRAEPEGKWRELKSEYLNLARNEEGKYPILTLDNEESVSSALIRSYKFIGLET